MQVHTREAIKRKALIPICNCFSISTGLLTGPKSGNTLSPVFRVPPVCPFSPLCVFFTPLRLAKRKSRARYLLAARIENRRQPKTARWGVLLHRRAFIVNKRWHPRDYQRSRYGSANAAFSRRCSYDGSRSTRVNVSYRSSFMFFDKTRVRASPLTRTTQRPPSSAHRPNFFVHCTVLSRCLSLFSSLKSSMIFFVRVFENILKCDYFYIVSEINKFLNFNNTFDNKYFRKIKTLQENFKEVSIKLQEIIKIKQRIVKYFLF